jgi:hypothetical protein
MAKKQRVTAVLTGVVSLCLGGELAAQGADGPLKQRIKSKIEAEATQQKARVQQEIDSRMAAIPTPEQIAQAAQVKKVQTALNFFTFDAGPADGIMGEKTRKAIEDYQRYLSYPVTGKLTEAEGQFLVGSYQKAQEDPATTKTVTEKHPDGVKGLLLVFKDALAKKDVAGAGAMPTFSVTDTQPSLSARCQKLAAASPPAGVTPDPASRDQATVMLTMALCQTRDVVIADSTAAIARAQGFTPDQITAQCIGFAPALLPLTALLPTSQPDDVASAAAAFVQRSGQSPEQMTGIATTCLGVGYSADQMDLAIGSAQLLVGMGQTAYGELLGHHLALGIGLDEQADLALAWYQAALARGDATLIANAAPDRATRILAAAETLTKAETLPSTLTTGSVPSFTVTKQAD